MSLSQASSKWAESLAKTLWRPYEFKNEHENKEKLTEKINFLQKSIQAYRKNPDKYKNNPNLTEEEKKALRLWKWYNANRKSYSSNLNLSSSEKELLAEFRKDPFYILKNSVEIVWKELVAKLFENRLKWTWVNTKVEITTDLDDIFWSADIAITMTEKNGEKSYLLLDMAVSDNEEFLLQKAEKGETVCQEFNLSKKLPQYTKIKRMVLDFERIIMADFIINYFEEIENWNNPDITALYNKIYEKRHNSRKKYESLWVEKVIWGTEKEVNNILTLNTLH